MEKKEKIITTGLIIFFVIVAGVIYLRNSTKNGIVKDVEVSSAESVTDGRDDAESDSGSDASGGKESGSEQGVSGGKESGSEQGVSGGQNTIIKVYVCGAVKCADVYELTGDARIIDAIDAAGGYKNNAAKNSLNLADKISDGQEIRVLTKKKYKKLKKLEKKTGSNALSDGTGSLNGSSQGSKSTENSGSNASEGKVNLNTASKDELMTLPGIGESKANAIIEYREQTPFSKPEDIMNITGIKEGVFGNIKDYIVT